MPWSGSSPNKTFTRTDGTRTGATTWNQAEGAGVDIISTDHDTHDQDIATALNLAVHKGGENTATANLPMGGFKHTGVADASARTQYLTGGQASDDEATYYATVGGTADAITLTSNGFLDSSYPAGMRVRFIAGADNTGAVTLAIGAVAADAVVLNDGSATALAAGVIQQNAMIEVQFDGTNWLLMSVHKLQSSQLGVVDLPDGTTATTQSAGDNSTNVATTAYADAAASAATPSGAVMAFPMTAAPSGWLKLNGGTIGSASSGGTLLASATAEDLFTVLWNNISNTDLPIQDSGGSPSTRGASAAADFSANKRMPVFDMRAEFLRGYDDGRGVGSANLGAAELDQFQGHRFGNGSNSLATANLMANGGVEVARTNSGTPLTIISDGTNGTPRFGSETRPRSISLLWCIKI